MTFDQRYTYKLQTDKRGGGGFGAMYYVYYKVVQIDVAIKFFKLSDLLK